VHLAGGKVIYDIDDNLLDPHPDPLADLGLRDCRPVCRYLLREADRVTVSTPFLRDRCLRLNPDVEVLPNCINPARFGPPGKRPDNDVVTIGCWGLPTHARDLASIILPFRAALGKIRPMARVVFCGIYRNSRLQDAFEGCGRLERLEPVPEYAAFLQLMAGQRWDIGLAPLIRGEHADCKADIKLLEYGGFGIAGVFSRHPAYVTVEDGITGLIADGDGWTDAILRLARDGDLRRRIAGNAREYALRERSVSAGIPFATRCLAADA
jgi:glycosyltransferase involved in cell wall biosynthesis